MWMTLPMDLRELLEARDGLPTEHEAARKIATFAAMTDDAKTIHVIADPALRPASQKRW